MSEPRAVAPFRESAALGPLAADYINDHFGVLNRPRFEMHVAAIERRIACNQAALQKLAHDRQGELQVPLGIFRTKLIFDV